MHTIYTICILQNISNISANYIQSQSDVVNTKTCLLKAEINNENGLVLLPLSCGK